MRLVHVVYVDCSGVGVGRCQQGRGMLLLLCTPPPLLVGGVKGCWYWCPVRFVCTLHYCCKYLADVYVGCYLYNIVQLTAVFCARSSWGAPVQSTWMSDNTHRRLFLSAPVHHREVRMYFTPGVSFLRFWLLYHDGPRLLVVSSWPFILLIRSNSSSVRSYLILPYTLTYHGMADEALYTEYVPFHGKSNTTYQEVHLLCSGSIPGMCI